LIVVRHTDPAHPDFDNLTKAKDVMKSVSIEINTAIQDGENRQQITDIQNLFLDTGNFTFVEPWRYKYLACKSTYIARLYIRHGPLLKQCRKALKERWFFLFNDVIVYAVQLNSTRYIFHQLIQLGNIPVN
jgi:hypothetical protein